MPVHQVLLIHSDEPEWHIVRTILQGMPDATIVGEATDHQSALNAAASFDLDAIIASSMVGDVSSLATLGILR